MNHIAIFVVLCWILRDINQIKEILQARPLLMPANSRAPNMDITAIKKRKLFVPKFQRIL